MVTPIGLEWAARRKLSISKLRRRGVRRRLHRKFELVRRDSNTPGASTYTYHAAVIRSSTISICMGLRAHRWSTRELIRLSVYEKSVLLIVRAFVSLVVCMIA